MGEQKKKRSKTLHQRIRKISHHSRLKKAHMRTGTEVFETRNGSCADVGMQGDGMSNANKSCRGVARQEQCFTEFAS